MAPSLAYHSGQAALRDTLQLSNDDQHQVPSLALPSCRNGNTPPLLMRNQDSENQVAASITGRFHADSGCLLWIRAKWLPLCQPSAPSESHVAYRPPSRRDQAAASPEDERDLAESSAASLVSCAAAAPPADARLTLRSRAGTGGASRALRRSCASTCPPRGARLRRRARTQRTALTLLLPPRDRV